MSSVHAPQRIVCLTEETTELLYMLGEQDRIVGISGFTVRPKRARKENPKVSTFIDAQIDDIVDLKPDLVIGFSDIQADIAQQLIKRGLTVWVTNHRSIEGILSMMWQLGSLVDRADDTVDIIADIRRRMHVIQEVVDTWHRRPRVYFEEWYDPIIVGIQWVGELIERAGGTNVFPDHALSSLAKGRIIADHRDVVSKAPDIIMASWCGKMFKKDKMLAREGWRDIPAVQSDAIYEIPSEIILQPGPASLIDGLPLLHGYIKQWVEQGST